MSQLPELIKDLAIILSAAAFIILVFRKLKQPVVLGYIIAGLLVGPNFKIFPTIIELDSIKTWADIGVIFLLFGLGLEFSFKKLLKVGGVAAFTAITEVTLTLLLGYGVGKLLGWNDMDSLFFGGILSIASTTIIIRAFDELGVKNQKFAGIVTGVLVIEDLVAVLLMVLLSTVAVSQTFEGGEMVKAVFKLAFFLVLWFVSGIFFIPTFFRKMRFLLNEETLLIISLAFCFLMVVLATYVGFSPALGAFIMGSILAETTKAEKIEQLTKSVKMLFGAIFFVSVGMLIDPAMLVKHILPICAATLVLLFGKPLFVTLGALTSGLPLKISIQSGMSLAQIGEFSFIIATLGLSLKVTSDFLYPIAVAVSVLTTFTTPYMIRSSEHVYRGLEAMMPPQWKSALTAYSIGAHHITEISDWNKVLRSYFINMVMFSVIIITLIIGSTRYLEPIFLLYGGHKIITAIITLAVLSPFLWALAFRRTQRQAYASVWLKSSKRGPLILLQFSRVALAVLYIGFLFYHLFSPLIALENMIITCIILAIFRKKIQAFYGKIETTFLANFNERDSATMNLTPWDTHITKFELNAQSPYIGKSLIESRMREEFGVNIVAIERGDFIINVPNHENHLYPDDKISVIGTDEQLSSFKIFLESTAPQIEDATHNISLHHFTISKKSSLVGQSIRESEIRERTQGLVVGIERNGERILNPESDVIFESEDKVWLVANEKRIRQIIKELAAQF
ncbi:MAG: sodium:proton antiporter [Mariniphaga sp.]|nr:sodium:proton antiporter [Mariniphaga sp.]